MGNLMSITKGKPEKPPEPSTKNKIDETVYYSNGDRYVGFTKNYQLTGQGTYYYKNGDIYQGEWLYNKRHGNGTHIYAKDKSKYSGGWCDNEYHGNGMIQYADGSYFQGKFIMGKKHGPGRLHNSEDDIRDERWSYGVLISPRNSKRSLHDARHESDHEGYDHSKEIDNDGSFEHRAEGSTHSQHNDSFRSHDERKASSRSEPEYEKRYKSMGGDFHEDGDKEDMDHQDHHKENEGNLLFKSQNENLESMEGKVFDVGPETLNIIEHMEMLNSRAIILSKTLNDWTVDDVCDWLGHLELEEYISIFKQNHVNGKVLLDISENDLKDEFQMTSFGHRKNFMKAVENLREVYKGQQGHSSDYVKKKIQKFYEKNKNRLKAGIINNLGSLGESRFYSNRKLYSRDILRSEDVINEDDENNNQDSPRDSEGKNDEKYHSHQSNKSKKSPKEKSSNYEGDDTDEKSAEKLALVRNESPYAQESKRDRTGTIDDKGTPNMKELNFPKPEIDEFKLDNTSPIPLNKDKSPENSSSDDDTDSSSDEEGAKKQEEKEGTTKPIWEMLDNKEKEKDKKKIKNHSGKSGNSFVFKSNDNGTVEKKPDSKKALEGTTKRHQRKRKYTEDINAKIKDEILRIFKNSGLNENFIIDYNELSFEKKIGEGGYGRVSLGKFSGIDVAIKEYGRTKLDTKRAEDFVKEIEVISNLRHPNIVLCMGACIHQGKYLMITEYLEEGSLFDHLHTKHTKIDENTMFTIIEDIALGMTYLHGRKVLHCDLKSSNILVEIDSTWNVKLCDFGLSRVKYKSDKKRFSNQRVGTPHWMAPEILRGEKYDEAADVYSFGMILWEMVTGEIPYHRSQIRDIIASVGYEGKQVPLPTKGPQLVLSIMKNCLNLNPNERISFKEILSQLQQRNKGLNKNDKKGFLSFFGS